MPGSETAPTVVFALLLALVPSCAAAPEPVEPAVISTEPFSAAAAHREILKNPDVFVLDVRHQQEYLEEHVANSVLIPLHELRGHISGNRLYPEINKGRTPREDQLILCVCASGVRSERAAEVLRRMGYSRARSLAGGLAAWRRAGLPLESSPEKSAK